MNKKSNLSLGLGLYIFLFLSTSHSQVLKALDPHAKINENPVHIEMHLDPASIKPGESAKIAADITIDAPNYVYKESLKLRLDNQEGLQLSDLEIKPTEKFQDPFSKKEKEVLRGQGSVLTLLNIPANIKPGDRIIKLALTYQACSEKYCLFPKTVKFGVPLKITESNSLVPVHGFSDLSNALAKGKLWAFLFVFIGGILTSFTPCIFPMIPITISVIGASSVAHKKSKAFLISIFYVLGIALTYSTLGVVAAKTGAFFGAFLGNIWVVGFISLVFLLMGLSMFGFFDIQMPAFVRNTLGTKKTDSGFFGAFLAGLISGIVASPCIGPVLVSILTYVAQTANVVFGFSLLFTFAIGMGMIFIVLGTFSGLAAKLPRAGKWMEKTKIIFGVVLIGMSIYYIEPFLPKSFNVAAVPAKIASIKGVDWTPYSEDLLKAALDNHQPIIIDFWAEWCVACHELEEITYVDSGVMELSNKFVRLKVDATHPTEEMEKLQKKYGVVGLPTVIFINKMGQTIQPATVTGFVKAPEFLERMKKAL